MKTKIESTLEILKDTYKISVSEGYLKVQDNILNAILNLKSINLNENIPVEKTMVLFNKTQENNIKYDLRNTDKNNNEYYFYPIGESEFKNTAYKEGKIFVRVFHPDGKIEDTVRRINKIWASSVLWNINSMYSKYILKNNGEQCHYSEGHNLKVFACPYSFKDSIPNYIN